MVRMAQEIQTIGGEERFGGVRAERLSPSAEVEPAERTSLTT